VQQDLAFRQLTVGKQKNTIIMNISFTTYSDEIIITSNLFHYYEEKKQEYRIAFTL